MSCTCVCIDGQLGGSTHCHSFSHEHAQHRGAGRPTPTRPLAARARPQGRHVAAADTAKSRKAFTVKSDDEMDIRDTKTDSTTRARRNLVCDAISGFCSRITADYTFLAFRFSRNPPSQFKLPNPSRPARLQSPVEWPTSQTEPLHV